MVELPQELIDNIIDSIDRGSWLTLSACSRVSSSWQKRAQKGLLIHVRFYSIDNLRSWNRNVQPESEVSSYVRCLHWSFRSDKMEGPDPFLESSLPGRFASFSNIKALYVWTLFLHLFDTTAIERTFGHLSHSLRFLQIKHLTTDPEKLCFLVSLLPKLQQITLPDVTMLEGGGPNSNHPHSFDFTGHVDIPYRYGTERFLRCIAGLNPHFESLEVRIFDNTLVDTLNLAVRSCSVTLTTVSIALTSLWEGGNPSRFELSIANTIRPAVSAMSQVDLSPCSNLRTLKVDPEMATVPEIGGLLQTIFSKHFEKLILSPSLDVIRSGPGTSDQIFHSFAERLYRLGATKLLTMVLDFYSRKEAMCYMPDVERLWPLFCEVGVIMEDYGAGWREWTCPYA